MGWVSSLDSSVANSRSFCISFLNVLDLHIQPFQPTPAPVPAPLAGWMSTPSTVTHPSVSGGAAIGLGASSIPGNIFPPL